MQKTQGTTPPRAEYRTLAAVATAVLSIAAAAVIGKGRDAMALAYLGVTCAFFVADGVVKRLAPSLLLPRVVILVFVVELIAGLALSGGGFSTVTTAGIPLDLSEWPLRITLPFLLVPLTTFLVLMLWKLLPGRGKTLTLLQRADQMDKNGLTPLLVLSAPVLFLYWFGTGEGMGIIGYIFRVLVSITAFLPFIAGRFAPERSITHRVWIACMAVSAAIGLLAGARLRSFLPPMLYSIGRISGLKGKRRQRVLIWVVAGGMGVLVISGVVGVVRSRIGRVTAASIDRERVEMVSTTVEDEFLDRGSIEEDPLRVAINEGIRRLMTLTNVVVPVLSPVVVPYRGLDYFWDELLASVDLAVLSGKDRIEVLDAGLGTSPANLYGFTVTERNSVEFGVMPEGWSRGGALMVVLFLAFLVLILVMVESLLWRLLSHSPTLTLMLFTVAMQSAVEARAKPLLSIIRGMVLYTISMAFVTASFLGVRAILRGARRAGV